MIARVVRITDNMPATAARRWARRYLRTESEVSRESLVAYLIHAPWRDGGESYRAAFDRGLIEEMVALTPPDSTWLPAERRRSGSFVLSAFVSGTPRKRGRPRKP